MADQKEIEKGLADEDPIALARVMSQDELERLIAAEDLLDKRHQRKKRSARWALLAQAMVGYVALAGFFANAYQNWNNKRQAEERAHADGSITLKLEARDGITDEALDDLRRNFSRYMKGVPVRTELVADIPPGSNGKRRTVLVER